MDLSITYRIVVSILGGFLGVALRYFIQPWLYQFVWRRYVCTKKEPTFPTSRNKWLHSYLEFMREYFEGQDGVGIVIPKDYRVGVMQKKLYLRPDAELEDEMFLRPCSKKYMQRRCPDVEFDFDVYETGMAMQSRQTIVGSVKGAKALLAEPITSPKAKWERLALYNGWVTSHIDNILPRTYFKQHEKVSVWERFDKVEPHVTVMLDLLDEPPAHGLHRKEFSVMIDIMMARLREEKFKTSLNTIVNMMTNFNRSKARIIQAKMSNSGLIIYKSGWREFDGTKKDTAVLLLGYAVSNALEEYY